MWGIYINRLYHRGNKSVKFNKESGKGEEKPTIGANFLHTYTVITLGGGDLVGNEVFRSSGIQMGIVVHLRQQTFCYLRVSRLK
jgi:hypothetical protein